MKVGVAASEQSEKKCPIIVRVWYTNLLKKKWGHASIKIVGGPHLNWLPDDKEITFSSLGFTKPGEVTPKQTEEEFLISCPPDSEYPFEVSQRSIDMMILAYYMHLQTDPKWSLAGGSFVEDVRYWVSGIFSKPVHYYSSTALTLSLLRLCEEESLHTLGQIKTAISLDQVCTALRTIVSFIPIPILVLPTTTVVYANFAEAARQFVQGEKPSDTQVLFMNSAKLLINFIESCAFVTPAAVDEYLQQATESSRLVMR